MAIFSKEEYTTEKRKYIFGCANGDFPKLSQIETLRTYGGKFAEGDFDLEILELDIKTKHFKKLTSKKKASKMLSALRCREPAQKSEYARTAILAMSDFVTSCEVRTKHRKAAFTLCLIFVALLLCVGAAGMWYADFSGLLYGTRPITYLADGTEYVQGNAIRFNQYVELSIPEKRGYDVVGVIDKVSGEQLFDSTGKSLTTIKNRDLSDYDSRILEVEYTPHKYTVTVMQFDSTAIEVEYTVEKEPQIAEPQNLPGYVFEGWYLDSQFIYKFSGDFSEYIDQKLTLYPKYGVGVYSITWEMDGGSFVTNPVKQYSIFSDIALPSATAVYKRGYTLVGWELGGSILEYFKPSIMQDVTLTAIWSPNQYSLKIYIDEEKEPLIQQVTYEQWYSLSVPYQAGYTFECWIDGKGNEFPFEGIYNYDSDMTIKAKYISNAYTITYVVDGSSFTQEVTYGESFVLEPAPYKSGYELEGWFDSELPTAKKITSPIYCWSKHLILYARYIKVTYITLHDNIVYSIEESIDKAYVIGNYDKSGTVLPNVKISIGLRYRDLIINLINVGIKGPANQDTIYCENLDYTLTVINTGVSFISGGNGSDAASANEAGQAGMSAIYAGNLILLEEESLSWIIEGGSGGNGHKGQDGKTESTKKLWLNYTYNGGDGSNGGDSGNAVKCKAYVSYASVQLLKGEAGKGGVGGAAGWRKCLTYTSYGSAGKSGEDGKQKDTIEYL